MSWIYARLLGKKLKTYQSSPILAATAFNAQIKAISGSASRGSTLRAKSWWIKRVLNVLVVFLAIFITLGLLSTKHATATAGINQDLSFEGKIVTSAGINIPDGTYNMEFKIYDASTGCTPSTGSGCHLSWTEDWLVGSSEGGITFSSGTFQVNLGATCLFSGGTCETIYTNTAINWDTYPLYLSMQVGNTSNCTSAILTGSFLASCGGDTEMKPYILLTSTPYAENANNSNQLGGLASSSFAQLLQSNTFQPTANSTGVIVEQSSATGSSDIFDVETNGGSSNKVISVTGPSANNAAVSITSQGSNAITLTAGNEAETLNGNATFETSGAGTATAFQVQNASGNNVFAVDTSGSQIALGKASTVNGAIEFYNNSTAYTVTINSGGTLANGGSGYSLTLPITAPTTSQCLQSGPSTASQLTFGSCGGGGSTTLQQSYNASESGLSTPQITISNYGPLSIQDANPTNGTNILNVRATASSGLGSILFGIGNTGATTFENSSNSSNAFQVENNSNLAIVNVNTNTQSLQVTGTTVDNGSLTVNDATVLQDTAANPFAFEVNNSVTGSPVLTVGTNNLVTNGDFEGSAGTTGWATYNTGAIAQNTNQTYSYSGNDSLAVTIGTTGNPGAQITSFNQTLPLRTYTLSFYAEATVSISTLAASFGSGTCALNTNTVSTSSFSQFYCTVVTTGTTSAIDIYSTGATATVLYIDNVLVTPATNLLTNPGFETGSTGWATYGTGSSITWNNNASLAYLGIGSLKIVTGTTGNAGSETTSFVSAMPIGTYTLSFYAGYAGVAFGTLSAGFGYSSGSTACSTIIPSPATINVPTTGFVSYSCTVTTTAVTTYVFVDSTSATSSTFYLDAVQVSGGSTALQYNIGSIQLRGVINSPVTIQPFTNSTTAFQVQNAAGTSNLLVADTFDGQLNIGGNVLLTQATTTIGEGSAGIINLGSTTVGNTIQIGSVTGANADTVSINTNASAIEVTTVGSTNSGSTTTFQAGASSESLSNAGDTIATSTNSTSAFQVESAAGAIIFDVDTTDTINLISNTDFDNNSYTGWVGVNGASLAVNTTPSDTYDGESSLQVTTAATAGSGAQVTAFTSTLGYPVTYRLSFDAMGATAFTDLAVTITGGSATCSVGASVSASGFTKYNCSFTTASSNVTAISINESSGAAGHVFYLDAVQLAVTANNIPYSVGNIQMRGIINTPVTFQPVSNSTTSFQIENALGTSNVFVVDTLDNHISLGGSLVFLQATDTISTESGQTIGIGNIGVGTTSETIDINTGAAAETTTLGSTSSTGLTTIAGGTGTGGVAVNAGSTGTITIGSTTAANTIAIGGVSTGEADTVNINTGAAAETTTLGSTNTTSLTTINGGIITGTNNQAGVIIGNGYSSSATPLIPLTLSSSYQTSETANSCSSSVNDGALYYNSEFNTIRACVNGSWQDLVSTADLALQLFGVVPNSGNKPGDLIGASATSSAASNTGGPCKVNYDTTTAVYVNSCFAYSDGRLVSVSAQAVNAPSTASSYQDLCLNSSGTPALLGSSSTTQGSQSFNNLTTTNATTYGQPLLCLAVIGVGSSSHVSSIDDVRTFTTTEKTYATITTALNGYLGAIVSPSTGGLVTESCGLYHHCSCCRNSGC